MRSSSYISNLVAISVILCVKQCSSQVFFPGTCPPQTVVQNFDINRYLGKWYENRNYFAFFQLKGICVTATYSKTDDPNIIAVLNNGTKNGKPSIAEGKAVVVVPAKNEAKLRVSFEANPFSTNEDVSDDGNYWVLDTDYDNYSVVWTCNQDYTKYNNQYLWILTRKRFPPLTVVDKAYNIILTRGLDPRPLEVTEHRYCPA